MTYRVQAYQGLKGAKARQRWRVGLKLEDGQTLWGPWQSTRYARSESAECEAYQRIKELAAALGVEPEYEETLRENEP